METICLFFFTLLNKNNGVNLRFTVGKDYFRIFIYILLLYRVVI